MRKLLVLLFLFTTPSFALTVDDAMNDVLNSSRDVCIQTNKAILQVINKIESTTHIIELKINEPKTLDETLQVTALSCCYNSLQSNSFVRVYNTKNRKDVFIGWMFSVYTSLNSLEDPKFDLTLLKCV